MSTIIDLTPQELADLKAFTSATDDATAVRRAMSEYLRFARRMKLKESSGQVAMDDNWQSLEAAELREPNGKPDAGAN